MEASHLEASADCDASCAECFPAVLADLDLVAIILAHCGMRRLLPLGASHARPCSLVASFSSCDDPQACPWRRRLLSQLRSLRRTRGVQHGDVELTLDSGDERGAGELACRIELAVEYLVPARPVHAHAFRNELKPLFVLVQLGAFHDRL